MGALAQTQLAALNRLIAEIAPTNRFYRGKLAAAGPDTVTLGNFTVLRYPGN